MNSSQAQGLVLEYDNFHSINQTYRHNPRSNYFHERQFHSITPWDDDEKHPEGITKFNDFQSSIKNNSEKLPIKVQHRKQTLNFIQKYEKRVRSPREVRNLREKDQDQKESYYHLNTRQIEFKQFQKKGTIHLVQNTNQTTPNTQAKNPTNNLFIKSQLFYTDRLKTIPKQRPQSQQTRKKNQYKRIREIESPSFLAIRSVDLREKSSLKDRREKSQKEKNQTIVVTKEDTSLFSTFKTIALLGSKKNSWRATSRSLQHKNSYNNSEVLEIQKSIKKIIKSAQESSKEMTDSLKGNYRIALEEIARKAKCNDNPDFIATNLSFIKKNSASMDEKQKQSYKIKVSVAETLNNQSIQKRTALTRERVSRIQRLKGMKTYNKLENSMQQDLSPYLGQKTLIAQRKKVNSFTFQTANKSKTDSPFFQKRVGTADTSPRKSMTIDRFMEKQRFQLKTFNDLISLMKGKSNKC